MAYAVIRIGKKLSQKKGYIGCFKHNSRDQLETEKNENVDHTKSHLNIHDGVYTYQQFIGYKEDKLKDKVNRKDAVFCVELILTASPEFFENKNDLEVKKWYSDNKNYLKQKYGDKFIGCSLHLDETTPHIHAYVVPLDQKQRLNARDVFNPIACKKMQDDYPSYMQSCGYDLQRGEPDKAVKHTDQKKFSKNVNRALVNEEKQEKAFISDLEKVIDNSSVGIFQSKESLKDEIIKNVKSFIKESYKGVYYGLMKFKEYKKDVALIYKKNKELTGENKTLAEQKKDFENKYNARENVLVRVKDDNQKLELEISKVKERNENLEELSKKLQNENQELKNKYEPKFKSNPQQVKNRTIQR